MVRVVGSQWENLIDLRVQRRSEGRRFLELRSLMATFKRSDSGDTDRRIFPRIGFGEAPAHFNELFLGYARCVAGYLHSVWKPRWYPQPPGRGHGGLFDREEGISL